MAGHRVYGPDKVGALTKVNSTTIQLAASTITLGGLQYDTAALQALTIVSGVGGLDTGSIAASTDYYVYAVLDGSDVAIVMSLSDISPTGFAVYEKVGGLVSSAASAVQEAAELTNSQKIAKSQTQTKITAVGAGSYTAPADCKYIRVRMVGGGGGGAGNSSNGSNFHFPGGDGGDTTFSDMTAFGGQGGVGTQQRGGRGGLFDLGSRIGYGHYGQGGDDSTGHGTQAGSSTGGQGGNSMLGGGGSSMGNAGNGETAESNSGGGGSGATGVNHTGYNYGGAGGAGGGGIDAIIANPTGSYSYSVGAGGAQAAGSNYTSGGGGTGIIIIDEFYK